MKPLATVGSRPPGSASGGPAGERSNRRLRALVESLEGRALLTQVGIAPRPAPAVVGPISQATAAPPEAIASHLLVQGQSRSFPLKSPLQTFIFKDQASWATFYASLRKASAGALPATPPVVDFRTQEVVGLVVKAALPGDSVSLNHVKLSAGKLHLTYTLHHHVGVPHAPHRAATTQAFVFAAIPRNNATQADAQGVVDPTPVTLPQRGLVQGEYGSVARDAERQIFAFRDKAAWDAFYANLIKGGPASLPKTAPAVDFSQEMVVGVVARGNTSGFSVTVDRVQFKAGKVVVSYTLHQPNPKDVHLQVVTHPFAFVALPRSDAPVVFA